MAKEQLFELMHDAHTLEGVCAAERARDEYFAEHGADDDVIEAWEVVSLIKDALSRSVVPAR